MNTKNIVIANGDKSAVECVAIAVEIARDCGLNSVIVNDAFCDDDNVIVNVTITRK